MRQTTRTGKEENKEKGDLIKKRTKGLSGFNNDYITIDQI